MSMIHFIRPSIYLGIAIELAIALGGTAQIGRTYAMQLSVVAVEEDGGQAAEAQSDSAATPRSEAATDTETSADSDEDASQPDAPLPRSQGEQPETTEPEASTEAAPAEPIPREEPSQSPEALLQKAFELSKTAKTPDELTSMIELCQQAIESGPSERFQKYGKQLAAWAFNRRGEVLAEESQNDAAMADFQQAVEYDGSHWKYYHNRAVSEAIAGNREQALTDFDKTIELKPNYANAYFNRGELLYDLGRYQDAVEDYTRAIRLAPRDSGFYNSRGHAWYRLNNYDRAIADYNRAVQYGPENAAAYVNRGDAYGDLAQYGRAASDYRNAIRIDPELGRAYQSAAWLMATCPEQRYRNPEMALSSAQKAIELDGEGYRYLDTLAAAYANSGDFENAKSTAAKAIELAPSETAEIYKARLEKYVAGEPYREPQPDRRGVATAQATGRRRGR